jgi:hypothetical protein
VNSPEARQFAIEVSRIIVLVGFNISIINKSFVLGHEATISSLFLTFHDLASKPGHIMMVLLLELSLTLDLTLLTILDLLLDQVGEAFILEALKPLLLLLLVHLSAEDIVVVNF